MWSSCWTPQAAGARTHRCGVEHSASVLSLHDAPRAGTGSDAAGPHATMFTAFVRDALGDDRQVRVELAKRSGRPGRRVPAPNTERQ